MLLPDPFDVLEVTLGPDARPVRLDDVTVVRTSTRLDHTPGNAVHHRAGLPAEGLGAALEDLARRFPVDPARLVAPHTPGLAAAAGERDDLTSSRLDVLVLDAAAEAVAAWPRRDDLTLDVPGDDRAWHGVTVLHRHGGPEGEDRARGAADERLRWWVAGQRQLVGLGRARVVRAQRFGTPVGAATLVWEPRVAVAAGHAGLAVVTDVVVHPAHRRLGVATTMVATLVAQHLRDFPRAQVVALVPGPDHTADPSDRRYGAGWRAGAALLVVRPTRGGDATARR